jgi:UDP-2,3-diacylglucosamine pyrophosphatase LpxH
MSCNGPTADLGCSTNELLKLTKRVINGHQETFEKFRDFTSKGENRIYVIPGNHDSALLVPKIWEVVAKAMADDLDKIRIEEKGIWVSPDDRIVVEHGHQIGADVNRYKNWPSVVKEVDGVSYLVRPWGELFVQKLFNSEEQEYSIIDNLSPETAGARFRMADKGLWTSAKDVAKFISFNLWETSLNQKGKFLGRQQGADGKPVWNVKVARKLGHKLYSEGLDQDDPFRVLMLEDSPEALSLRAELDQLVSDSTVTTDDEVKLLCDLVSIRHKASVSCDDATLGYSTSKLIRSREGVLKSHLKAKLQHYPKMRIFVYGHTHKYEDVWQIKLSSVNTVSVMNTGAFQRLVDEDEFVKLAKNKKISPANALKSLELEDLSPCYTVAMIEYKDEGIKPSLWRWHMSETGKGKFVKPNSIECI